MVESSVSEDTPYETNSVERKRKQKQQSRQRKQYSAPSGSKETRKQTEKCRNCGGNFPHKTGPCQAKDHACNYCKKQNHFVVVCMKKKRKEHMVKRIQLQESSDNESEAESDPQNSDRDQAFGIKVNKIRIKQPKTDISVKGCKCKLLVDTGSTINYLNEIVVRKMKIKPKISKSNTDTYA